MKHLFRSIVFVTVLLLSALPVVAQFNVTPETNPAVLAQKILGKGITILNAQYHGHDSSAGIFRASAGSFAIDSGIVLTTGYARTSGNKIGLNGPATDGAGGGRASVATTGVGDALLSAYAGQNTKDACVLEFDFIPQGDSINIRYVFGSEEYPSFVCSNFNDVFGFFISGPGIVGTKNIATVPGAPTTTPVAINSINSGTPGGGYTLANCQAWPGAPFTQYYVNNSGSTTLTYNGHTVTLTAKAKVTPCQVYHIRLAIADAVDQIYDSGVFIEANSFTSKKDINTSTQGPYTDPQTNNVTMVEGCKPAQITLTRAADITGAFSLVTT
jgi:hypothetical protein